MFRVYPQDYSGCKILFTSSTDIQILNFSVADILFCYRLVPNGHFKNIHFFWNVYMFYHLVPLVRSFYLYSNYNMLSCHSLLVRTVFRTSWHE
ncbi:hypothetical protein HanXRQr2_Chr08g0346171 [Helianthus annuus]|uniref:Uncharacterized protein n=1 Tax=Helianthus annuus TaxID=4232 RepID=A0A9K3ND75_HELAN|nr:hypothetical protein HanXRQr2_Chr08g0346171 [Helianthus annuus]